MTTDNRKRGFTLMEMLIVVAVIAVLVAIAILTMNSSLTKTKEAADLSNLRSAYAELSIKAMMTENVIMIRGTGDEADVFWLKSGDTTVGSFKLFLPEDLTGPAADGTYTYRAEKSKAIYTINFDTGDITAGPLGE